MGRAEDLTARISSRGEAAIDELEAAAGNAALVLTSSDPKFWCNGINLEWLQTQTPDCFPKLPLMDCSVSWCRSFGNQPLNFPMWPCCSASPRPWAGCGSPRSPTSTPRTRRALPTSAAISAGQDSGSSAGSP